MSPAIPGAFSLPPELRQRAWKALVKELGIVDATRFVMAVEPGEGDSVEKYAKLWDGMTLETDPLTAVGPERCGKLVEAGVG